MGKDCFAPEQGTRIERLMAMYTRLSPENRYYILGKAEGICVAQTAAAGGTPPGFAKRQDTSQKVHLAVPGAK